MSLYTVPLPLNEPVRPYAPGTPERASIERELARQSAEIVEIPCVIGGVDVYTGRVREITMPCDHRHIVARVHLAGACGGVAGGCGGEGCP